MQGWIKMHRQLLEWEWYKDINTKTVFLHLLLFANIKDVKYMGKIIKKGSLVIRTKGLADDLSLTENEVRTALKHLKQTGEIKTESTNKFTIVTVVNYSFFQDFEECATQTKHNQNTNKSHSINKLLTSIEEEKEKEEKEDKNIYIALQKIT